MFLPRLLCALILCLSFFPSIASAAPTLRVIQTLPQGEAHNLTQITVRFSEAMRPLGVMEESAAASPLRLTVPGGALPEGNYRWLDPATLSYLFDEPVDGPFLIEALVPAGTRALSGATLEKDLRWNVSTPAIRIERSVSSGVLPPKDAEIVLRSNHALNLDDLRAKTRLVLNGKSLPLNITEREIALRPEPRRQDRLYTVRVLAPLPPDKEPVLTLEAGIRPIVGSVPAKGFSFVLKSYSPLRAPTWRSLPEKKGSDRAAPEEPLYVRFNNPVLHEDLLGHLSVSPAVPELPSRPAPPVEETAAADRDAARRNAPSASHSLAFSWAPRTTYTVTLRPGLKDIYGGVLNKASSHTFSTGDYRPLFSLPHGKILEAQLGGVLPLTLRNVSPVNGTLRFLPWGERPDLPFRAAKDSAKRVPGATEHPLRLDFSKQRNTNIRHALRLEDLTGHAGNGLFLLRLNTPRPSWSHEPGVDTHNRVLQITDLGLTVKVGRENSLVWVTRLSDGQAVEGARLSLYGENAGLLRQGTTDIEGLAALPGRTEFPAGETLYLKAVKGEDSFVQELKADSAHGKFRDYNALPERDKPWNAHLLAQLPLYQPGRTVRFTLYARVFTDQAEGGRRNTGRWQSLPDGEVVSFRIKTPMGREVYRGEGAVNAYGSLASSFTLSPEAELGAYSATLKRAGSEREIRVPAFSVASFRPPDFKVDVTAPSSQPQPPAGQAPLAASVSAGYFSGASLAGGEVALALSGRTISFAPPRLHGYAVGDQEDGGRVFAHRPGPPRRPSSPLVTARLNAVLDAEGKAAFTLPPVPSRPGLTRSVSLEATVSDPGGLTSQGTADFLLHPSAAYVGLKVPFFSAAHSPVALDVKAATFDDKPLADVTVTLRAERRMRDGSGYEAPVWESTHVLNRAEGERVTFTPGKSGLFRVSAVIKDAEGRENLSRAYFWAPGPDLDWGGGGRGARLELLPDQEEYAPGDTALVAVKNPLAQEGERFLALISLEREGVRETRVQELSGPAPVIEAPLTDKDAPYVFLSVVCVRGRSAPPPTPDKPGADNGAPGALLATTRLNIKQNKPKLVVSLATDAAVYRPGATVNVSAAVRDDSGKAVKSQLTLLAVDARILRAAGEQTRYNPALSFDPLFSLGVRTLDSRRDLADLSLINLRRLLQPSAARTLMAPFSEGAAHDAAPSSPEGAGEPLRENFAPDVFWLAQQETDANGAFSASFTLPDSLTSHRIVAVAADKGGRFAKAETSVTAAKPLQLLSALPRFAVEGDVFSARVLAQNLSREDAELSLTAEASGLVLEQPETRTISLRAGAGGVAAFTVRAPEPGRAELRVRARMTVSGKREEDAARFTLPVLPAAPLTTVAAAGLLTEGETFTLPVRPPAPLDSRSRLDVIFAPSPAAGLPLTAHNLLDYPWDCLEQRLSRAWVRALRLGRGELLGLPPDPEDRQRIREVMESVPRFQKSDGGFALWQELREPDFYLTAYTLLVNGEMKRLGLALPADVETRALGYLAANLDKQADNRPPDLQAVALWILSRDGASAGRALRLFPETLRRGLDPTKGAEPLGLAALLLAAHALPGLENKGTVQANLLAALEKTAAVTPTQVHFAPRDPARFWWSMGSSLRDNGLALWALATVKPEYPRLEALAFWLSQGLGEKRTLSTQEAMFGLLGLSTYLEQLGGNRPVTLRAVWNDRESATRSFARLIDAPQRWTLPASELSAGQPSGLALSALAGNPYWTARLVYASSSLPVQPVNAGFTLTRAWSRAGPYRMGDTVDVTLTLTVPAIRRRVLVFDPFPAGLEPLYASRADLQTQDPEWRRSHPWQRRELRDSGLLLYADRLNPGTYTYTYTLRAAAPGAFVRPPAHAEEMYTPEVFGSTGDERVEVRE